MSFLDVIPDPEPVRARLASVLREQALLRGLLRLAERKRQAAERERLQAEGRSSRGATHAH